jgi:hypothetical protein
MREPQIIRQFERRLVESGYPAAKTRRHVQEMAEHREDLREAAIAEGCTEPEAEEQVDEQLGNPIELAESIMAVARNCSWWGRHPFVSFCLLPLPILLPIWFATNAAALLLCWPLYLLAGPAVSATDLFVAATSEPSITTELFAVLKVLLSFVPPMCEAAFFAWMAKRVGLGFKWGLISCGICSLMASFSICIIGPGTLGFALGPVPENWTAPIGPVLVALALAARQRRAQQQGRLLEAGAGDNQVLTT